MLGPTVIRPCYIGVRHLSGAHKHIFYYCQIVADLLIQIRPLVIEGVPYQQIRNSLTINIFFVIVRLLRIC
jgi:hypothetical protein